MSKSLQIAIGLHLAIMALVLVPPLLVSMTGTEVTLETVQVDPRALFRGDYVILEYAIGEEDVPSEIAVEAEVFDRPVYATITLDHPAELVGFSLEKPNLEPGQACLTGVYGRRWAMGSPILSFPQIAQYFVPEGEGKYLESLRGQGLLAVVKTTRSCDAVLTGVEFP